MPGKGEENGWQGTRQGRKGFRVKAVVCTRYGPPEVLRVEDVPMPVSRRNQVSIRVAATAMTSSDCYVRGLNLPARYRVAARLAVGLTRPRRRILGMVLAGEVVSAGADATAFGPCDQVFGLDRHAFGTYAEYVCWPQDTVLAAMPAGLTHEEAAAIPYGGLLALHFLRRAGVRGGQRVAAYGASGAVGTSAVQLARHVGADVTGVCSGANLELVRSLGAATVIDYTAEDFTEPAALRRHLRRSRETQERSRPPAGPPGAGPRRDLHLGRRRNTEAARQRPDPAEGAGRPWPCELPLSAALVSGS